MIASSIGPAQSSVVLQRGGRLGGWEYCCLLSPTLSLQGSQGEVHLETEVFNRLFPWMERAEPGSLWKLLWFWRRAPKGCGEGENTRSETRRPTDGGAEDVRDTDRQKGTQSQEEENQAVEDGWKAGSHAEPRAEQQASRWTSQ